MANPPNLNYCKITGNFKAFIADSIDSDDLPDFVPMEGYGSIWPNVTVTKNTQEGYKSTYFNSPVTVTVDTDGDLGQEGRKYLMVLAESSVLNPAKFNYTIMLNLTATGELNYRQYGPFSFDVTPGGEVDITDVIPVAASAGTPIIQGPQGPPGDMVPVTGPSNVSGGVGLGEADLPSTRLWTLTGDVPLTMPLPSPARSGTIRLVLTQDDIGGWTIGWPASVKWPDGIPQQPVPDAGAVTVVKLLWTGAAWLGTLDGTSFA